MPELIGETIGEFQIVERIGRGGMADVYRANQPSLNRDVAIKVLPAYYAEQDDTFLPRFKIEAQAIASLRHPNILMVMSYGEHKGITYIVMEYVPAGTLKERMAQGMTMAEILEILRQVGSALDYAHEQGVVHRDVKPSNILMPKPDWALLTDFGLARMVGGSNLTQSGMTVGTPSYMSPEQGSGKSVDSRSDLYSLGVILYEMTVGELPYQAETPMAVVVKHIVEPLPVPRTRNPLVPDDLQRVILKAIAKDPEDRYQTAAEMMKDLAACVKNFEQKYGEGAKLEDGAETMLFDEQEMRQVVEAPVQPAQPTQKTPAPSKDTGRSFNWKLAAIIVGVLLVVGVLVGGALWGGFALASLLNNNPQPSFVPPPTQALGGLPPTLAPPTLLPPTQPAGAQPQGTLEPLGQLPAGDFLQGPRGSVLFQDDFSDPNSGWDRFSYPGEGSADYVDGGYSFIMDDSEYLWWATPGVSFISAVVDVDVELMRGTEDNAFGVVCGYRETGDFYVAVITSDGYYGFYQMTDDGEIVAENGFQISDAIHLGGQKNHLQVHCLKDRIVLNINGQKVNQMTGLDILPGQIGFWAEMFEDVPTEIRFDDLVVTAP